MIRPTRFSPVALTVLLFGATACGSDDSATGPAAGGAAPVSFSVATSGAQPTPPAVAAQVGDPSSVMLVDGADTLVITRVRMLFDEVELERAGGAGCGLRDSTQRRRSDDCAELDLGPRLVDLPLGEAPVRQVGFEIPAGRYEEFEFELDDAGDDTPAQRAFRAANPEWRDASVRVEGRWRGQPFTWTANIEAEFEYEFEPALVVEAGVNDNVTIDIDLARWFRDASGRLIAPTAANASLLAARVRTALDAYCDRDRDGRRDDGRPRSSRR